MTQLRIFPVAIALGLAVASIAHWSLLIRRAHAADRPEVNRSSVAFLDESESGVAVASASTKLPSRGTRPSGDRAPTSAEKNRVYDYFRSSVSRTRGRRRSTAPPSIEAPATPATRAPDRSALATSRPDSSEYSAESVVIDTRLQDDFGEAVVNAGARRWAPIAATTATEEPSPATPESVGDFRQSPGLPLAKTNSPLLPVRGLADDDSTASGLVYSSSGPAIRVEANGPRRLLVGRSATYIVTLRNEGSDAARGLFVRLTIPETVEVSWAKADEGEIQRLDDPQHRQIVWAFDHLAERSKRKLELAVVPKSGDQVDFGIEWTLVPQSETVSIDTIRPELALTLIGPETAIFGEAPIYTVQVFNQGTGLAEDVSVELTTNGGRGKSIPIGDLEAGQLTSFKVELAKLPAGLTQLAAVAACSLGEPVEAAHPIRVGKAELQVDSFGPATNRVGSLVSYEVHVRNVGDSVAEGVTATVNLPDSVVPVKLPVAALQRHGEVTWKVGTIPAGEVRSYTIRCDLTEPGDHRVRFSIADRRNNRAASELSTKVAAKPDVRMVVGASDGKVSVGDEYVYRVQLENHSSTAAQAVQVTMYFAPGVEPVSVEGCRAHISNGTVVFDRVSELKHGVPKVLRVTARANLPGSHAYRVELTTAEPDSQLAYEGLTAAYVARDTETTSHTLLR